MYAGNERIASSLKHLKTTTVTSPRSSELALKFQRQQEGYVAHLLPSGTRLPLTSELL